MVSKSSWVPWYRRKDYKGNLSEEEKRILDSFRLGERHPATRYEDLPGEVQSYLNRIELELYDKKQEAAAGKAFFLTGLSLFLIYLAYIERAYSSIFAYVFGAVLIAFAWFQYRREWKRNASELLPKEEGAPSQTDQGIQAEWELDYIVHFKMEEESKIDD